MEYQAFCVRAQSVKCIDGTYRRRKEAGVEVRRCVALKFLYVSKVMMRPKEIQNLKSKFVAILNPLTLAPPVVIQ